jgi:flagellar FliL protein
MADAAQAAPAAEAPAEEDEGQEEGKKKKGAGLAALLPKILKIAAIVLASLIVVIGVAVITVNIALSRGQAQSAAANPSSPYVAARPTYAWFDSVGTITCQTADPASSPHMVSVHMELGYDTNDRVTPAELALRIPELKDFARRYFSSKTAAQLAPENEEQLKQEILEYLNTRLLSQSKVRIVTFDSLSISAM